MNEVSSLNNFEKNGLYGNYQNKKESDLIVINEITNINEMILKFKIDGLILTNTTNQNRDGLVDANKNEIGGLSGLPLQKLSLKFIKKFYKSNGRKIC